jgi:hypothetical protein
MKCGDLKVRMNFLISKRFDLPQRDANLSVVGRRLDSPIYIFGPLILSQSVKYLGFELSFRNLRVTNSKTGKFEKSRCYSVRCQNPSNAIIFNTNKPQSAPPAVTSSQSQPPHLPHLKDLPPQSLSIA